MNKTIKTVGSALPLRSSVALACAAALLAACGGGGSETAASVATAAREQGATLRPAGALSSLGADGWATVSPDGGKFEVTGGEGATTAHIHVVRNRAQLVRALYGHMVEDTLAAAPDHQKKLIYIQGRIDLNVDDEHQPMTHEAYMRQCGSAVTPYTSFAEFDAAYKAAYDPNQWVRQSLEADGRPPALPQKAADGALTLEGQRACFASQQAKRIVLRVGSNTSLIGLGKDAAIVGGNLHLGDVSVGSATDAQGNTLVSDNIQARNIVVRNIHFSDAYDMFPGWDPKDSFSISASDFGAGLCSRTFDAATNQGPHQCPSRKGGRWNSEYDLISVLNAANVWIDGNTFDDGDRPDKLDPPVPTWAAPFNVAEQKVQHHDGLVDVTLFGNLVTLSYNHFRNHDKTHLIGGTDVAGRYSDGREVLSYGPDKLSVTLHHNRYENTVQRQPRVRFGKVHVYNNYYSGGLKPSGSSGIPAPDYAWSVAWTIGTASKLYVENNVLDIALNGSSKTPAQLTFGDTVSSTLSNQAKCEAVGYSRPDCATYFHEAGTLLNGTALGAGDLLRAAQAKGTGSNAAVNDLAGYWVPGYAYELQPAAQVKAEVLAKAGAGRR
jgi:pectate lyase